MPVFVMAGCLKITPIKGWATNCFRLNDKVVLISKSYGSLKDVLFPVLY